MRTNILYWITAFVLIAGLAPAQSPEGRFAFIDLDQAFDEYYKTKLADQQLKEQAEEFNAEREELMQEYEALQEEFNAAREQAQNTALSEEVRNEKRNEAEEKLIEIREFESRIRRFDRNRRQQLDEQSQRMRKRIVDEIRETIQGYVRNQGYTAVIDISGESLNGVPLVIYADPDANITEDVLELINKGQ